MKKILILLLSSLIIISCDDREDWVKNLNQEPTLFLEGTSEDNDTLRTRLKYIPECENCKEFQYNAEDPDGEIAEIQFNQIQRAGEFLQNGEIVETLGISQTLFYYHPLEYGEHIIELKAIDNFGSSDEKYIIIDVFDNMQPVADLETVQNTDGIYTEYILDGSGSQDGDAEYGGFLLHYRFDIDMPNGSTKTIITQNSRIIEGFPGSGNYNVELKVMDSDSVYSEPARKTVVIN